MKSMIFINHSNDYVRRYISAIRLKKKCKLESVVGFAEMGFLPMREIHGNRQRAHLGFRLYLYLVSRPCHSIPVTIIGILKERAERVLI